jgi:MFS family permease
MTSDPQTRPDPARGSTGDGKTARYSLLTTVRILLLLDLLYLINAMDRQLFPILIPHIRVDYALTSGEAGLLATIFTLGMGLAGIPAGYLTDRLGRKNVVLGGLVVFSATTVLQAVAAGLFDMTVYRIISGLGEGVQNAALFAAVGAYFHQWRALAIGTVTASFGLGAFIGPLLGSWMLGLTGSWRGPLVAFGLLGIIVFVAGLLGVPKEVTEFGSPSRSASHLLPRDVSSRLLNRNVVCCAVVAITAGFAIYGYLGLYPTFLRGAREFTLSQASLAASLFGIGALAGVPAGMLADRMNQRLLNIIGLSGLAIVGGLVFTVPTGIAWQAFFSLLLGIFFTGVVYTNTNALIQKSVHPHKVGQASGLFVAALYIPASVSGYFFARLNESLGWGWAGLVQLTLVPSIGLVATLLMRSNRVAPPAVPLRTPMAEPA